MPRYRREVNSLVSRVGRLQNRRYSLVHQANRRKRPHNEAINRINQELEQRLDELTETQDGLFARVALWCDTNWQTLTGGQTRTVKFATGTFRRAENLSAIGRADGVTDRQVVRFLQGRRRTHLRRYMKPDYDAIKADPAALAELMEAGLLTQTVGDTMYIKANNCPKSVSRKDPSQ